MLARAFNQEIKLILLVSAGYLGLSLGRVIEARLASKILVLEMRCLLPHCILFRWVRECYPMPGSMFMLDLIVSIFALSSPALPVEVLLKELWNMRKRTIPQFISDSFFY